MSRSRANKPLSTTDMVIQGLRQSILSGDLSGDVRVRQEDVASAYGVSHTSAREALRQLSADGFLRAEPRRGMRVIGLSLADAAELIRLRRPLEVQALALAIPRMGDDDLKRAEKALKQLDRARKAEDVLALNAAFHDTLYAPCEQHRTLALIRSLRHAFDRYFRFLCNDTKNLPPSQSEHWDLLAACTARDVQGACAVLDHHIAATFTLLAKKLPA